MTYYVDSGASPGGNGSSANPFNNLNDARVAMETTTVKNTVVNPGTYREASALILTSADNGISFTGGSGGPVTITGNLQNLVTLDGASNITLQGLTFSGTTSSPVSNGVGAVTLNNSNRNYIIANIFANNGGDGLLLAGSSQNTVSGNQVDNSADSGIELKDGSNSNFVDSNLIDGTGANNTQGGGIFGHGISSNTLSHNQIQNTAGMGIGIEDFGGGTANSSNSITKNLLINNDTQSYDSGAIYLLGRSDEDTNSSVTLNFISEQNANPTQHQVGIYLDDYASGVYVNSNIVQSGTPGNPAAGLSYDFQLHGGNNDTISNNIFDTGSGDTQVALIQSAPSDVPAGPLGTFNNDAVYGNLNPSERTTDGIPSEYAYLAPYNSVNVANNDYWGASGQNTYPDSNPHYDPQGFVDRANGNYNFTGPNGAANIDFTQIDESGIGLMPSTAHSYQLPARPL